MRAAAAALVATALLAGACQPKPPKPASPPAAAPPAPAAAPAATPPTTGPAPTPAWIAWQSEKDGSPKSFAAGPFKVKIEKLASADGGLRPKLTISDDAGAPFTLLGSEGGMSLVTADVVAAALDRGAPGPQLLVRTFTYGAHCCFVYQLVERRDGAWKVSDLGQFDGAGMPTPKDLDGDGRLELAAGDQAFLYAFEPYAGSGVPAVAYEVVGGKIVDVSGQRRFRPYLEADYAKQLDACRATRSRGLCAPAAALAARLGRLSEVWPIVESTEPAREPFLETETIDGRQVTFPSFRAHLEWFLGEHGYLPKQPVPKAATP